MLGKKDVRDLACCHRGEILSERLKIIRKVRYQEDGLLSGNLSIVRKVR